MAEQNSNDRRIKMTRMILKEALTELMKEQPLHEISIKKICETADINRSTFYHHYASQYELYDSIVSDVAVKLGNIIKEGMEKDEKTTKVLTDILSVIEKNRELALILLTNNSNFSLGDDFTQIVTGFITGGRAKTELSVYCTQFILAGFTSIIILWLNNEQRKSAREVAMLLNALIMHGVKRAAAFSGKD